MERSSDFAQLITDLRAGTTLKDLSAALQEVTAAAVKTGKKATLSLTLKITPKGEQIIVADAIKKTIPEHDKPDTIMFYDSDYNLSRHDVRQLSLDEIQHVKTPAEYVEIDPVSQPIKEVNT